MSLSLDRETAEYDLFKGDDGLWHETPLAGNQVTVVIDAQCGDDVADKEFLAAIHEIVDEHVNKLLSYIRLELGQCWVNRIPFSYWGLNYFLRQGDATWITERGEEEVLADPWDHAIALPPLSDFRYQCRGLSQADWRRLRSLIVAARADADPVKELLANAKQHFDAHSYRAAAVEAVAALELASGPYVREQCKSRGISHTRYDGIEDKLTIAVQLKVLLPLLLCVKELDNWLRKNAPKAGFSGESLLEACRRLNDVRNKVVHKGRMPDESDIKRIRDGIKASELLLAFIG